MDLTLEQLTAYRLREVDIVYRKDHKVTELYAISDKGRTHMDRWCDNARVSKDVYRYKTKDVMLNDDTWQRWGHLNDGMKVERCWT